MFIKPYEEAKMTLGLRALVRRLIPNHPSLDQMKRELLQAEAGEYGEKFIMKQLEKLTFTKNFQVLHNITFQHPYSLQLDVVVITQYEVIIIESKNIRGEVELKKSTTSNDSDS
ncbi:nuclease-related domain-containing protein [Lysinibacillus boronitolerans]|uniref:nuclease-related domain-containing protein n=1 Tax=Lysinibacillus boronitolerans TaxID=309788 RepID=UPI0002E13CBB|nr:nuclease-related domain-containing protein [Lysinibacillus boronitolerans]